MSSGLAPSGALASSDAARGRAALPRMPIMFIVCDSSSSSVERAGGGVMNVLMQALASKRGES